MSESRVAEVEPLEETVPSELFKSKVAAWAKRIGMEPRGVTTAL